MDNQSLSDKFFSLHQRGAADFGPLWLFTNRRAVEIAQFNGLDHTSILNRYVLSRVVYETLEIARKEYTPKE